MNTKIKKAIALGGIVALTSGAATVHAATGTQKLDAVFNNIKVTYDGVLASPANEPFMINGSVYVGLRDAGEITNNSVSWDSVNKTVHIQSKEQVPDVSAEELAKKNLEIASLNNDIDDLNDEVADLEAELKKLEALLQAQEDEKEEEEQEEENLLENIDSDSIDDMLDDLDDDYDKEHSVSWEFDLDFDTKKHTFELEISYESDKDGSDFNDISNANMERFITNISEDIQNEFGAFPIEGELIDYSEGDTIIDFTFDEDEEFDMTRYFPLSIVEDFEKALESDFADLLSDNAPDALSEFDIDYVLIEEHEDNYEELTFHIYTTLAASQADDWNAAENNALYIRTLEHNLDDLTDAVSDFFGTDKIDGYILAADDERLASFEDGRLDFDEYDPN